MYSRFSGKLGIMVSLTMVFILWLPEKAVGTIVAPTRDLAVTERARARLLHGFEAIQEFFAARDFSLLVAWREARASDDPYFFDHKYPKIAMELETWAAGLDRDLDGVGALSEPVDYTFLLEHFAPWVFEENRGAVVRDNALASVCMICVMDDLRCDPKVLHPFLRKVTAEDPSPLRKAEALRWWRRTGGRIDAALMRRLLSSPVGSDPVLRLEIAEVLFALPTRASLQAQELLLSGPVNAGDDPAASWIACTAMGRLTEAGFQEIAPELIRALDASSPQVRACAVDSLEQLSGRDFGFDPDSGHEANAEAVGRLRAWWSDRGPRSTGASR